MRFAGHWRAFLGVPGVESDEYLDYMHARYYDANVGRFLSVDPTWESADLIRPQTWNRYSYVLNNPINFTDPDGKKWSDIFSANWWTKKFNQWFPPKQVAYDDVNRKAVRNADWSDEQAERMANPEGAAQRGLNTAGGTLTAEGVKQGTAIVATAAASRIARLAGMLRAAAIEKGNFGMGVASRAEAEAMGAAWVGKGHTVTSEGIFISADGLRQFRPPSYKPRLDAVQANFEWRVKPSGQSQGNGHLDVIE